MTKRLAVVCEKTGKITSTMGLPEEFVHLQKAPVGHFLLDVGHHVKSHTHRVELSKFGIHGTHTIIELPKPDESSPNVRKI